MIFIKNVKMFQRKVIAYKSIKVQLPKNE